tara:strand:- start:2027 stop:2908 length:882 start_codon:yes stop_codon:yes gene_type:complete
MGVIKSVDEQWSGDDASISSGSDGSGSATVTRKFGVVVSNSGGIVKSLDVLSHVEIPKQNEAYPLSQWFRCSNVSATRTSPITFEVTASYEAETTDPEDNPVNEPAEVSFSSTSTDGAVDEDIDGNPIVTVNGEPITGVTMPFVDLKANVTKNIRAFNPLSVYVFGNAVNSVVFMGFPAGVVRCSSISAKQNNVDTFTYWTVSVEFEFRKPINTTNSKSWYKRIRHEGFLVKIEDEDNQGNFKLVHAQTGDAKATKPVMLKEDGTQELDPEAGHWQEWPVHRTENLNSMGLGV